jgi:hypothetical protein
MQLQIECATLPSQKYKCLICNQSFRPKDAQVLVCDEQGESQGEICSPCLGKGFGWIQQQFNLLNS